MSGFGTSGPTRNWTKPTHLILDRSITVTMDRVLKPCPLFFVVHSHCFMPCHRLFCDFAKLCPETDFLNFGRDSIQS